MKTERKLLLFGLLREGRKCRFRDGDDLSKGVREPFKRRLTRLSVWRTVLRGLFRHVPLRVGRFLAETPSASCTLSQGGNHV